ncbi:mechanosensitive ion channel [Flavobacterium sp. xlx-214]|uniref:mechanosensitive ion channel family protein n=1 Tax=unclassified Flavobacterium TaxID=196869 RepID=UPI0013D35E42|nr:MULTISPECIES: mechanosensitive ion channel domain-containing protein [unclassified Flavobacterium]MBA5793610.1 mechanosensitive ion channel [Flavobacterium sp. xlx-221]QMI84539.1 mechanosensitive ion channel [Flavobacterium sp. xlx-214]
MDLIDDQLQSQIYAYGLTFFKSLGIKTQVAHVLNSVILLLLLTVVLYAIDYILRRILMLLMIKTIRKSKTRIDDFLIHNGVLKYATHLVPILIARQALPFIFTGFTRFTNATLLITDVLLTLTVTFLINAGFKTFKDVLKTNKRFTDKPLDSYFQVITILLYAICAIILFSEVTGKDPVGLLTALGAASAIVILVFKDTILGFVASIQVSSNDMVRVGDWIEMQKYGADGTVLSINLSTVKVQNFDKTVTTIPTYALISDSFKNYRTMQKSGGRRIKRSLNIKIGSIRFLEEAEIQDLKRIKLLKSFIIERQQEIDNYNQTHVDDPTMLVNGRRMTNIGLFREYIKRYLLNNPNIHKQFHLMVRHMQPTEHGLPIEVYAFTNTVDWPKYEGIMADIFDHILAVVPFFHLEIFETPSSTDLQEFLIAQHNQTKKQAD